MRLSNIISVFILLLLFAGCSNAERGENEKSAPADISGNGFVSSSAAVESKDSSRRFIRTAELKFKVKNVVRSTYDIEDITTRQGGFVIYTNLGSQVDYVTTTAISADSSLETTYYTVSNQMTLRIPNTKLDTTLKEIARNIDFLDYRVIKAEDVALDLLANEFTQTRAKKNEERITKGIEVRNKKSETSREEDQLLNRQEQSDKARIANLSLTDKIKFSTVSINIYQRASVKREVVPNDKNIDAYEPGFGSKLMESLKSGWAILAVFIVFLARLWGLLLFGFVIYFIIRVYLKRRKKSASGSN